MVSREHPPIRATIITTTAAAYSITTEWEMEEEQEVEEEAVAAAAAEDPPLANPPESQAPDRLHIISYMILFMIRLPRKPSSNGH